MSPVMKACLISAFVVLAGPIGCESTPRTSAASRGLAGYVGLWSAGRSTFEASSIRVYPDGNLMFSSAGCFGTWFSWHEGTVKNGSLIVSPPVVTYSKERFEEFLLREVRGSRFLVPRESIGDWDAEKETIDDASDRIGYKLVAIRPESK